MHTERLKKEIAWHEGQFQKSHPLNRWPLHSSERNAESFHIAKTTLFDEVGRRFPDLIVNSVLLAPAGHFDDLRYVQRLWPSAKIQAVDVAEKALLDRPDIPSKVADISNPLPFPAASFDVVVSTLFFHHVIDEGFDRYLEQLRGMLRPGGVLITMEYSWLHPPFWMTRPLKRIVGNITGQVEHERPLFPGRLIRALHRTGFGEVHTFACSFGHNRTPIPLTNAVNALLRPVSVLKHFAWQVGYIAVAPISSK